MASFIFFLIAVTLIWREISEYMLKTDYRIIDTREVLDES
jgi:hypothetical protein